MFQKSLKRCGYFTMLVAFLLSFNLKANANDVQSYCGFLETITTNQGEDNEKSQFVINISDIAKVINGKSGEDDIQKHYYSFKNVSFLDEALNSANSVESIKYINSGDKDETQALFDNCKSVISGCIRDGESVDACMKKNLYKEVYCEVGSLIDKNGVEKNDNGVYGKNYFGSGSANCSQIVNNCFDMDLYDDLDKMNKCMTCDSSIDAYDSANLQTCYSNSICDSSGINKDTCSKLVTACHAYAAGSDSSFSDIYKSDDEIDATADVDSTKFKSCVTDKIARQYAIEKCETSSSSLCNVARYCSYVSGSTLHKPLYATQENIAIDMLEVDGVSLDDGNLPQQFTTGEGYSACKIKLKALTGGSDIDIDSVYNESASEAQDRTTLERTLCLLVMVMKGRIARAIFAVMIISFGFLIILAKINWTNFLVLAISGGLIFGSGQIAVTFFMPKAIKVMENDGSFKTYTPEAFIASKCPHAL